MNDEKIIRFNKLREQIQLLLDKEMEIDLALMRGTREQTSINLDISLLRQGVRTLKEHAPVVSLSSYGTSRKRLIELLEKKETLDKAMVTLERSLEKLTNKISQLEDEFYVLKAEINKSRKVIRVDFISRKRHEKSN